MKLEDVIKEYYESHKSVIVVPKYGRFLEKYQEVGSGGFQITKYDKRSGLVQLTMANSKGRKLIAYINIENIASLIDETDLHRRD